MLKDGTEDGTGEVEDGTAKTGVVKNQDGRCLVSIVSVKHLQIPIWASLQSEESGYVTGYQQRSAQSELRLQVGASELHFAIWTRLRFQFSSEFRTFPIVLHIYISVIRFENHVS